MFKVMLVDDERLARVELRRLIEQLDDVTVVAEANSSEQALQRIQNQPLDLIFLDIKMPQMSGLELAKHIDNKIQFVFCTAYSEHAVDAFELDAIDYLVKPINFERLVQTFDKLRRIKREQNDIKESSSSSPPPSSTTNQYLADNHGVLLKFGDSSKIVRLQNIHRFRSIGNHVEVHTSEGKSYLHSPLSKIGVRLDPVIFFKVSRSDIIRVDNINKIEEGITVGSLIAILNSKEQVEVSRRQTQSLKKLFNVW